MSLQNVWKRNCIQSYISSFFTVIVLVNKLKHVKERHVPGVTFSVGVSMVFSDIWRVIITDSILFIQWVVFCYIFFTWVFFSVNKFLLYLLFFFHFSTKALKKGHKIDVSINESFENSLSFDGLKDIGFIDIDHAPIKRQPATEVIVSRYVSIWIFQFELKTFFFFGIYLYFLLKLCLIISSACWFAQSSILRTLMVSKICRFMYYLYARSFGHKPK